jgi:hypothetical protein
MGSLVRTLLIQVQKTKVIQRLSVMQRSSNMNSPLQTDLSLSLLSLDHLLRSQQLTFAFVGLAPSLLVLYGIGGWLKRVWNGEKRGKTRRMAYVRGVRCVTCEISVSTRLIELLQGYREAPFDDWQGGTGNDGSRSWSPDLVRRRHASLGCRSERPT